MPLTPRSARLGGRSRLMLTGIAMATFAAALGACGGGSDVRKPDTGAAQPGGTMVIVQPIEPGTLFPPRGTSFQELPIVASLFDRLAELDTTLDTFGDTHFKARLASGWKWAPDSLSIAFKIDTGARWHDGVRVRGEDVKYTFHVYNSEAVGAEARALLGNIDSVSVPDSMTAVFWFKRRTPQQFMDATYSMWILPSHLLSSIPDSLLAKSPFGRQPVGSGRFRFSKWEAGSRLEIIADTGNPRGRAMLDRVIWSFVGDFGAATVKLFSGEADLLERIKLENIPQLESNDKLRLAQNFQLLYGYLGFNLRARGAANGGVAAPHPIFGDVRVRRALTMAFDRRRMVRAVLDSLGMVAFGPAPRALIPDTTGLRPIPFDLAAAKALLDSAGWTDTNGDGIREHQGQKLEFELLVPVTSATRMKLAEVMQTALKDVGANMILKPLDGSVLGPKLGTHDFDAWMGSWIPNPGLQGTRQTWTSRGTSNYQSYLSPAFDALVDSALTTFDRGRMSGLWTRALQQSIDEAPSVWLYEEQLPLGVHTRIKMGQLRADGWYVNLADWSIYPGQQIDRDKAGLGGAR